MPGLPPSQRKALAERFLEGGAGESFCGCAGEWSGGSGPGSSAEAEAEAYLISVDGAQGRDLAAKLRHRFPSVKAYDMVPPLPSLPLCPAQKLTSDEWQEALHSHMSQGLEGPMPEIAPPSRPPPPPPPPQPDAHAAQVCLANAP